MGNTTRIRIAAAAVAAASGLASGEPTAVAVEYFNAGLRSYFLSADRAEISRFDAGAATTGWVRTGGQFGVFANAADAPASVPVCRFRDGGPETVFYTTGESDCEQAAASGAWTFEGVAFHVQAPDGPFCPAGTAPVWRTVQGGTPPGAGNSRYTVDATVAART